MKTPLVLALAAAAGLATAAPAKELLNLDRNGVAIQGYDPVAFFTDAKPVRGRPDLASTLRGATYRFASPEHKAAFEREPETYAPAFGGFCAYGVSRERLVDVDVDAFQIVNGRLLLQYSTSIRDDFNEDTAGNLARADRSWPALVEAKGK